MAWGVELSVEALSIESETFDIWNPIVFLDTDYGRISFGAPESVYETYGLNGFFNEFGFFSMLAIGIFTGSTADFIALDAEEVVPGISYDGVLGQTRFGLSYNNYSEGSDDIDMFAAAIRHSFESLDVFATYEKTDFGPGDIDRYVVGAEGNLGQFGYGIAYANGATVSEDVDTTSVYLDYDFNDRFTVGANVLDISVPGNSDMIYGVKADYTFWRNAYLGASYYEISDSSESFTNVRLGWKLDY